MNHWKKPVRPLKFTQLNSVFLTHANCFPYSSLHLSKYTFVLLLLGPKTLVILYSSLSHTSHIQPVNKSSHSRIHLLLSTFSTFSLVQTTASTAGVQHFSPSALIITFVNAVSSGHSWRTELLGFPASHRGATPACPLLWAFCPFFHHLPQQFDIYASLNLGHCFLWAACWHYFPGSLPGC